MSELDLARRAWWAPWARQLVLERQVRMVRRYIALGWPLCVAAYLGEEICSCGRDECSSPGAHRVSPPSLDVDDIVSSLRRDPRANVMVATGVGVDVVEVALPLGRLAVARAKSLGPVAVAGSSYLLFAASGPPLLAPEVRWYGQGGYVLVPPSSLPSGHTVNWLRRPESTLPRVSAVADALGQQ